MLTINFYPVLKKTSAVFRIFFNLENIGSNIVTIMKDFLGYFFRSDPEVFIILPSIRRVFKWEICLKSTKNPRKIKRKYYLPPPSNINLLSLEDRRLALNGHVLPKSEWNNLEDSDFVSDFSKSSLTHDKHIAYTFFCANRFL